MHNYLFMKQFKRYLVTAALPYANGPIHIGHLAGVYIPADIYVRYLRLQKKDVLFICGSDEHGVPITIRARQENKTPKDVVDFYHEMIKKSFEEFGISFDIYSRTTSKTHYELASDFFKKLYEKGEFIELETEQFFDEQANQFLADRYIIGTCPHCGFEKAYGDQCEKCGTSLNPLELVNPISALTNTKPVLRKTKHWYLRLDKYEDFIRKWVLEEHANDWRQHVVMQVKSWLDMGLKPRAVTRDLDWGVPVPLPEAKGKVLYVWFDAPIGYISATKELTADWEKYWKDPDTKLVHFIGKDNIVFHCIIFPIMLKAEGSYILPDNVPANAFLNLENDKISTSRNWAVWLHEYLEDFKDKQDVLRYVLTINAPENKDNYFTWKDFQNRNNNELLADLGNFVNRVLTLINKYESGMIPPVSEITENEKKLFEDVDNTIKEVTDLLEKFCFKDALFNAMNLARLGNKYFSDNEPWKLYKNNPERLKTVLNISAQLLYNISIILDPFLPFTTAKIRYFLNTTEPIEWQMAGKFDLIKPGTKINEPTLLFEPITDEQIQKQLDKLKSKNETSSTKFQPLKSQIDYEIFSKLDLRIGTIIEAQKVENSDKLLKLKVDLGFEKRDIVAGIAKFYKPEKIIGKKVVVLANLKPKKIMGLLSQGMILMAGDDNYLSFVSPENNIDNGLTVS